jgi:ribonuclease PH
VKALITDDYGALVYPVAVVLVVETKNGGHSFEVLRDRDRFSREQLRRTLQNVIFVGDHPGVSAVNGARLDLNIAGEPFVDVIGIAVLCRDGTASVRTDNTTISPAAFANALREMATYVETNPDGARDERSEL